MLGTTRHRRRRTRTEALTELFRVHGFSLLLAAFAATLILFGGSSRYDRIVQVPVRLMAIVVVTWAVFRPLRHDLPTLRIPALLLGAAIGLVLLQLVPLPPAIWTALPGRQELAAAAPLAGFAQPWRPLALSPDMALNTLLALTIPLAALWGLAVADKRAQELAYPAVLAVIAIALLVETVQLITGNQVLRAVYEAGFELQAAGIFANRNHQALLLAMGIPLALGWQGIRREGNRGTFARWGVGAGLILLLLVLLATGSRAGLVLGLIGLVAAAAIFWSWWSRRASSGARRSLWYVIAALALAFVIAAIALFFGRGEAIDRLLASDTSGDMRARAAPVLIEITRSYLPFGSGFGSFDAVFRRAEPAELLDTLYFNQAHNDLLQVVLEAGVPGLALMGAAIAWLGHAMIRLWASRTSHATVVRGRAAGAALILAILASAVDYPLRTPTMMAVVAVLVFVVAAGLAHLKSRPAEPVNS
jgi:hypothetical protein